MSALIEARQLDLRRGGKWLARGLDLAIHEGQRVAILGKNGAGKSTLLHTLAGLHPPDAGRVQLAGHDYAHWSPRQAALLRGILTQHASEIFGATVLETALIGRHPHLPRWAIESAEDENIALAALAAVGLEALALRRADSLSGGERQRLSIATLLTQAPRVLLLDEPLTHLDLGSQVPMLQQVCEHAAGGAVVMVLHEPHLALRFCTHALVMFDEGHWQFGPAEDVINAATLTRLHGHHFHEIREGGSRVFLPA